MRRYHHPKIDHGNIPGGSSPFTCLSHFLPSFRFACYVMQASSICNAYQGTFIHILPAVHLAPYDG